MKFIRINYSPESSIEKHCVFPLKDLIFMQVQIEPGHVIVYTSSHRIHGSIVEKITKRGEILNEFSEFLDDPAWNVFTIEIEESQQIFRE